MSDLQSADVASRYAWPELTRVSVHVSDDAQRDGVAVTPATAADYRLLAGYLLRVADEAERMEAMRRNPPVQPGGAA